MRPFVFSLCLLPLLTGCGIDITAPNVVESHAQNGAPIHGGIQGGHQSIVNAHIHLLAAGTTGYGSASTSLLASGTSGTDSIGGYVTAAADGTFSIDSNYTCAPGQELYLLATGGNSQGDPNGPVNPSIALMAALGVCPGSGSLSPMIATLNEVSTVAMAYALAPFATDATHIGAPGTPAGYISIENAFAAIDNLIDRATGTARDTTPAGNGVAPQAALNTLADILAACIDTNGTTPPTCSTLFSLATADGTNSSTRPTDTATAAINIAHHPASNVAALYALVNSNSPFGGALTSQPSDLTLTLTFATNTSAGPNAIAIDAGGQLWFPYNNGLGALTPVGAPRLYSPYTDSGLNGPQSIAIDTGGDIWLANFTGSSFTRYLPNFGTFSTIIDPGLNSPSSVVIDPAGDIWISDYLGRSLTKVAPSGSVMGSYYVAGTPRQVLSDTTGDLWVPNYVEDSISELAGDGSDAHPGGFTIPSLYPAAGSQIAALDNKHTLWVFNQDASIIALSSITGAVLPGTPFNLGAAGRPQPQALALDGGNGLWTLSQMPNPIDPQGPVTSVLTGFTRSDGTQFSGHTFPFGLSSLAVDGSGNLWLGSSNAPEIYEVLGAATPVVTPISVGIARNTIATRP